MTDAHVLVTVLALADTAKLRKDLKSAQSFIIQQNRDLVGVDRLHRELEYTRLELAMTEKIARERLVDIYRMRTEMADVRRKEWGSHGC